MRVLPRGADADACDADVVRLMGKTMEMLVLYGRIEVEVVFVCELGGGRGRVQMQVELAVKLARNACFCHAKTRRVPSHFNCVWPSV